DTDRSGEALSCELFEPFFGFRQRLCVVCSEIAPSITCIIHDDLDWHGNSIGSRNFASPMFMRVAKFPSNPAFPKNHLNLRAREIAKPQTNDLLVPEEGSGGCEGG